MTLKNYIRFLITVAIFGMPVLALAQGANVTTTAVANTPVTTTSASVSVALTAKDKAAIVKADQEIKRRLEALTAAMTRAQGMIRVSTEFKTSVTTALQNQITAFGQLQTKIDADTDSATLKDDVKSVTASYRIFALVLPQVRIAAASDRIINITTMMAAVGTKLQTRVAAAAQAGADTKVMVAALTDMATKMNDAQTQAQAAVTSTVSLQPDQGDKTVMAANTKALVAARASVVAGQKDLEGARKDIDTVLKALKTASVSTSASTTVSQ